MKMNRIAFFYAVAMMAMAQVGCDDDRHANREEKQGQNSLTPLQQRCIKDVATRKMNGFVAHAEKSGQFLMNGQSTIQIDIEYRRFLEAVCLMEARCYGIDEPLLSVIFSSCLTEAEKEDADE